eukprot:216311-Chlamydomonas_euryale.AAC.1
MPLGRCSTVAMPLGGAAPRPCRREPEDHMARGVCQLPGLIKRSNPFLMDALGNAAKTHGTFGFIPACVATSMNDTGSALLARARMQGMRSQV